MADDPQDLLRLADAVEKAAGADRELDMTITLALGIVPGSYERATSHGKPMMYFWHRTDSHAPYVTPERYTASLDAAMTLVPPDHDVQLTIGWGEPTEAVVAHHLAARNDHIATAAMPALALCAAALKARAHSTKESDNG